MQLRSLKNVLSWMLMQVELVASRDCGWSQQKILAMACAMSELVCELPFFMALFAIIVLLASRDSRHVWVFTGDNKCDFIFLI
jgi:hypothetical protein